MAPGNIVKIVARPVTHMEQAIKSKITNLAGRTPKLPARKGVSDRSIGVKRPVHIANNIDRSTKLRNLSFASP